MRTCRQSPSLDNRTKPVCTKPVDDSAPGSVSVFRDLVAKHDGDAIKISRGRGIYEVHSAAAARIQDVRHVGKSNACCTPG